MTEMTPGPVGSSAPTTASGPGGSIYDLGYQGYEGPRLGRRSAATALFTNTLKGCFGIGRGGRAKIAPLALAGLTILPAVLAVGIAAIAAQAGGALEDASPVNYATYNQVVIVFLMLFCAAQAPELFGRDQRYHVLPLYFSRAITRSDYALAKVGGLFVALLVVDLVPQVILFFGRVLVAADPVTGLGNELSEVPRFVAQGLLTAGLLASISGLISAWTPRRAYATAAIIALLLISPIVVALVAQLIGGDAAQIMILFSPGDLLEGTNAAIFGTDIGNPIIANLDISGLVYLGATLALTAVSVALTVRRYLRIAA
jgi:ABC-2 type transport system permease protein